MCNRTAPQLSFREFLLGLLWILSIYVAPIASAATPKQYYIISPEPLSGSLSVMSLESGNTISTGGYQLKLQKYETGILPAAAFTSGSVISGTGFFTLGSSQVAADLPVPSDFAGTAFVIPHIVGSHKYFISSPSAVAHVTVQVGAVSTPITINAGMVVEFDAGATNTSAGLITSDVPVVVSHTAYSSGVARDAFPLPPASTDVVGIRSQNVIVAALQNGTSVTAYASDGTSASYSLSAGQQVVVSAGVGLTQGQGSALHVVANLPVTAIQYDDGDGADATAFWPVSNNARYYSVPTDAQYLAIACTQPNITVTLYAGTVAPQTQTCSGSNTVPGKAYFGAATGGANITAGGYVIGSAAIYAMYEDSVSNGERNLLGFSSPAAHR